MSAREVTTQRPLSEGTLTLAGIRAYHERLRSIQDGISTRQSGGAGENARFRERLAESQARV